MKTLALALTVLLLALVPVLSPCQSEDATMCTWNAQQSGNGLGTSFTAVTEQLVIPHK